MIPVNKPYLPSFEKYTRYLERAYAKAWLTNNGPMVQELKLRLEDYLGVKNLLPVANGTLAMQLAYKVFGLQGEAVTTPFTFIASSSSLAWEGVVPRFADVDAHSYNLCPQAASGLISAATTAIVPVHVYGNPCNVHAFAELGQQQNLKIIYDAAHAFGIKVADKSVLSFGDASTLSFHATKVFHSVEGGAVIFNSSDDYERAVLMTNFGIDSKTGSITDCGINTKLSEVHAAMGLAVLDDIDSIMQHRIELFDQYCYQLKDVVVQPVWHQQATTNGAYMPVTFADTAHSSAVLDSLARQGIIARRYFSPSLNQLAHYSQHAADSCPVSESLASRTLCLPLYYDLSADDVTTVTNAVKQALYGLTN